jgi:hypothetical protein
MRLRRPSHATVIAYLALFVALSGTAMAVKKIGPSGLKKNAVTTKKIADSAVTTPKIANSAITEPKLANDAVSGAKLAPNSVGTNKLRDDAVESAKLANNSVTEPKIANDAVRGAKVLDGSLGLADVAQVVSAVTYDPGTVLAGACASSSTVDVPGLQIGDDVLVFPRDHSAGWDIAFVLDVYGPTGVNAGQIAVRVCNVTGSGVDPAPLPLLVLGFR